MAERTLLRLAGGLLLGGLIVQQVALLEHPGLNDDNYREVFTKYSESSAWIAVHFVQFAGVLLFLAGLLVLHRIVKARGTPSLLPSLGTAAAVAAAAGWAALQAIDGVAQKYADDAWATAAGAERAIRYADAQTVRWIEYGMNSYSHFLMGLAVTIFGIVVIRTEIVARWLGWVGAIGGLAYMAGGIAVAYAGFESGFESAMGIVAELGFLVFAIGLLATGKRMRDSATSTAP